MSDTGYITRGNMPSGPTSDLVLFAPDILGDPRDNVYDFVMDGLDPGAPAKRRQFAESMYVVGYSQLQSVPGAGQARLGMYVTGRDGATLDANLDALVKAVTLQTTWELHVTLDGRPERAWSFSDADQPVVGFTVAMWRGLAAPVTITCPRYPTPLAGAI